MNVSQGFSKLPRPGNLTDMSNHITMVVMITISRYVPVAAPNARMSLRFTRPGQVESTSLGCMNAAELQPRPSMSKTCTHRAQHRLLSSQRQRAAEPHGNAPAEWNDAHQDEE